MEAFEAIQFDGGVDLADVVAVLAATLRIVPAGAVERQQNEWSSTLCSESRMLRNMYPSNC